MGSLSSASRLNCMPVNAEICDVVSTIGLRLSATGQGYHGRPITVGNFGTRQITRRLVSRLPEWRCSCYRSLLDFLDLTREVARFDPVAGDDVMTRVYSTTFAMPSRQLRNAPGFSLVAILTLALGIGANTAIASAVYAVLLRSLPFANADRLVLIKETHPQAGTISASYRDVLDWRAQSKSFRALPLTATCITAYAQVTIDGEAYRLRAAYASADLFPTLGHSAATRSRAFCRRG